MGGENRVQVVPAKSKFSHNPDNVGRVDRSGCAGLGTVLTGGRPVKRSGWVGGREQRTGRGSACEAPPDP